MSKKTKWYRLNGKKIGAFGPIVEQELLEYYKERRAENQVVTVGLLVAFWRRIDPENVEKLSAAACRLCIQRFMEHHNMSWRKKTHKAQVNKGSDCVIKDFVEYIRWKKIMLGITDDRAIANADETNVYFSPSFERTIADRGSRTVAILQPNSSKRCTAMLGCAMNGEKLPPYVIFQGKNTPGGRIARELQDAGNHGHHQASMYGVQSKAWMDEDEMERWINTVWAPYAATIPGPKILIIDSFVVHLTGRIRNLVSNLETELEIVPPGFTSKLQVMDVGINKPFKDRIRHSVEDFLTSNLMNCKPTRQVVSHWIGNAWEDIPASMIINTWRHVGFCGGLPTPHPNPEEQEMNNHHDPLAIVPGNDRLAVNDDNEYDTDASLEY